MARGVWLTLFLASLSLGAVQGGTVSIAAFNIEIFGVSKFSKPEVVDVLSKIVRRYDVILIQEIRDISETVIYSFLDVVNNASVPEGITYAMNVSQRLGRTNSKEQYAFMYRVDKVCVLETHQYDDPTDLFERPPYSVLIRTKDIDVPDFFLMGIHVQPSSAFSEINSLLPVYEQLVGVFNTSLGVILGDLNADCGWLSQTQYLMLDLVTDGWFDWLISTDTTTNNNDCSYDRIVVSEGVRDLIANGSAGVFLFDQFYNLTREETLAVSDHYPVHMSVEGEASGAGSSGQTLSPSLSIFIVMLFISSFT